MRRDDDYLRQLLFEFEAEEDWLILVRNTIGQNLEQRKKRYHIDLLCDAGLMTNISDSGYRMTNFGHDFLNSIREDTIWRKTKEGAAKVGGASLGLIADIATAYVKQEIETKLGIKL